MSSFLGPVQSPGVKTIRAEGTTALRGIARALNERGMLTRRGGRWHLSNMRNLLAWLAIQQKVR